MKCVHKLLPVLLIGYGLMSGSASNAAPLFQSIPDLTVNPVIPGYCSACSGGYRVFDTFSLGGASTIDSVTFAVSNVSFPTNVNVSIWTVSGGLPGVQLLNQTFTPADFASVVTTTHYTSIVTVNPTLWALLGGTYDISFYNPAILSVPAYSGGSGLLYQTIAGFYSGQSAGFILDGTAVAATPIPAAWPLFATGFAGLGWLARRRRKQAA